MLGPQPPSPPRDTAAPSDATTTTDRGTPTRMSEVTSSSRPLMVLLDLLGRRWALRVLWELRDGELPFGALRRRAGGLSQSVLTVRLSELKQAGLLEAGPTGGYRLTADGQSLVQEMTRLDHWADRWANR